MLAVAISFRRRTSSRARFSTRTMADKPPAKREGWFAGIKALHLGGFGAVVLTLATQNIAQEIVGGLAVKTQSAVGVGDEIRLQDGTAGIVHSIGWVHSHLRGYDDLIVRIPNSQFIHSRVTNISRARRSQVKQTIRFRYKDLNKVPDILRDIKEEMKKSCPKLVHDGSAIYRAVITSYEPDHVQAVVNFHFDIPAETEASNRNRQEVLLTISRVMEKHGAEFALPTYIGNI